MSIDPAAEIHPSAIVETGARIGAGARIGPFCIVGAEVTLGAGVHLKSHVVVAGRTEIGEGTVIWSQAVLGEAPQDRGAFSGTTRLVIGARNVIREGVTMNVGTDHGRGITRVGDDGMFMTGSHVGHDVVVGDRVVMANQAALAGHASVGDDVIIGGLSGVHQRVRIGRGAIIGAVTMVNNDVIPYGLVQAPRGRLEGLNLVGLRRRGLSRAELSELRAAFRALATGEGAFVERARALGQSTGNAQVKEIVEFVLGDSDRSFLTPR